MDIIKQICEMCRYKSLTNGTFPCVDCSSRDRWELAETIVVSSKDIQAQQQEIERLKNLVNEQSVLLIEKCTDIDALTADKDEQTEQMKYLLRRTLPILEATNNQQELIEAIDALLGGGEG